MHFFYLDESGDSGRNLNTPDQPTMVLGGVSLRDEGWNKTHEEFTKIIKRWFEGSLPADFELHACDLLSPRGRKYFLGYSMARRTSLALDLLKLLEIRKHGVHLIAIDKAKVANIPCGLSLDFNPSLPYLLAFDYLITYINWFVKEKLGRSARGMIILDRKEQFHKDIERITRRRRFEGLQSQIIKWICEFSYPVDSRKNPMIQFSDLVILCGRRFLEIEHGYHNDWNEDAKKFYARCYAIIDKRIARKSIVNRGERVLRRLNEYIKEVSIFPLRSWKSRYDIEAS